MIGRILRRYPYTAWGVCVIAAAVAVSVLMSVRAGAWTAFAGFALAGLWARTHT